EAAPRRASRLRTRGPGRLLHIGREVLAEDLQAQAFAVERQGVAEMVQRDGEPRVRAGLGERPAVQLGLQPGGDPGPAIDPAAASAARALGPSTMSPLTTTGTETASFTARTAAQSAAPL